MSSINKIKVGDTVYTIADGTEPLIAPVQNSLVASKTYAVGEQFIYNGNLYKATASIASGGTITINGNCALADSIADQVTALNEDLTVLDGDVTNIQNQIGSLVADGMIVKSLFLASGYNSILLKCPSDSSTHLLLSNGDVVLTADKGGSATSFETHAIIGTPDVVFTGTDASGKTNYMLNLTSYSRPLVFISSSALSKVQISPYTHS